MLSLFHIHVLRSYSYLRMREWIRCMCVRLRL